MLAKVYKTKEGTEIAFRGLRYLIRDIAFYSMEDRFLKPDHEIIHADGDVTNNRYYNIAEVPTEEQQIATKHLAKQLRGKAKPQEHQAKLSRLAQDIVGVVSILTKRCKEVGWKFWIDKEIPVILEIVERLEFIVQCCGEEKKTRKKRKIKTTKQIFQITEEMIEDEALEEIAYELAGYGFHEDIYDELKGKKRKKRRRLLYLHGWLGDQARALAMLGEDIRRTTRGLRFAKQEKKEKESK